MLSESAWKARIQNRERMYTHESPLILVSTWNTVVYTFAYKGSRKYLHSYSNFILHRTFWNIINTTVTIGKIWNEFENWYIYRFIYTEVKIFEQSIIRRINEPRYLMIFNEIIFSTNYTFNTTIHAIYILIF